MSKYTLCILTFLTSLFMLSEVSYALERDYAYTGYRIDGRQPYERDDDNCIYVYSSSELCYKCFKAASDYNFPYSQEKELDISVIPPTVYWFDDECSSCENRSLYAGYFHFRYKGGYPFLKKQIEYTKKYPHYQAYWPETSHRAEEISDRAVILFENLIDSTALQKFDQHNFITDSWYFHFMEFTLPRSLCVSCFRFSDFYRVAADLKVFSASRFSLEEYRLIADKLDSILDELTAPFIDMYAESLYFHPTKEMADELLFLEYATNQEVPQRQTLSVEPYVFEEADNQEFLSCALNPNWFLSDFFFFKGTVCNDYFLHEDAIAALSESIRCDSTNIDAYIERAHAYFELGKLDLALEDYNKIKEMQKHLPPFQLMAEIDADLYPMGFLDYSGGFCIGITQGGSACVAGFFPAVLDSCKGLLHGLWCFVCSPVQVSKEIIHTSYECFDFIRSHSTQECLETMVPELRNLCKNWDKLSDYERGKFAGYIIGKYGTDVLIPAATFKGVSKFRQFKRSNTLFTLECCTDPVKKGEILEKSAFYVSARASTAEAVKKGRIIAQNPNVAPHVLQKKHNWDRVIELTGNTEEDFKRVVRFLEENKIFKGVLELEKKPNPGIVVYRYRIDVNGERAIAEFFEYSGSSELYIKDAWIKK